MTCKHCETLESRIAALEGATKPAESLGRPVLVTTAHRGVFFGYADAVDGETLTLKRARLCVYWSSDLKGFLGLASDGPSANCRIGKATPSVTLRNITGVAEVTPEAVKRWEEGPWK